jgi:hypothetical protein
VRGKKRREDKGRDACLSASEEHFIFLAGRVCACVSFNLRNKDEK